MKKGQKVYCRNEGVYSEHLTKRKRYEVVDLKEDKIRVKNDNRKLVWISSIHFSDTEMPKIESILIDDEIKPTSGMVEATISFEDEVKRFAIFMTMKHLTNLFHTNRNYILGKNLIIVREINERIIEETIIDMDKKDELISNSIKY